MARYWTKAEIVTKIEQDLDLEDELFIQSTELLGYINEGIDEAEAEIHDLYEDYFLKRGTITLVAGTEEYALPSDIYAMKIRRVIYNNGSKVCRIHRARDTYKMEERERRSVISGGITEYEFIITHDTPGTPKICLIPTPQESGAYVKLYYLRNANRLSVDADVCDIPEFVHFVMQFVKVRCYEKEGHPNLSKALMDLEKQRALMQATLASMVPDEENEIEPDLSFYGEMT